MKYLVTHATTYSYSDPVPLCKNLVHLHPRDSVVQKCEEYRLTVVPTPTETDAYRDYFGNRVNYFAIHESHRRLSVTARSRLTLTQVPPFDSDASPAWESVAAEISAARGRELIEVLQFLLPSPQVANPLCMRSYAAKSFPKNRPVLRGAIDLMERIHRDFDYDTSATSVNTPLHEVFSLRKGVCQDFAHIQIGCLRALGIPARYISGYLRTEPPPGQPKLVGADASHAWTAVFCGGHLGWVELDPTNNLIVGTDHMMLAWGRDYSDVCPVKGVFVGGGKQTVTVSVDVREPRSSQAGLSE